MAGFESFPTDALRGRRHITAGIGFIQRAIRGSVFQTTFVVGPDGETHHARDVGLNDRNA